MKTSPEHDLHHRSRRKGTASRQWLVVSSSGQSYLEEVGKHSIMKRTGLPARDLRVLDPLLMYPSTILGRERAIVINLEQIKAVITANEVLVPNSKDPMVGSFVQDLIARVSSPSGVHHQAMEFNATMGNVATSKATSCWPSFPGHHHWVGRHEPTISGINAMLTHTSSGEMAEGISQPSSKPRKVGMVLPFEFRALEGCLESACRSLEAETLTLEKEAYPALDELTSKLSTLNLERVRQIKSRLVAISGRVQKVRDELEHLLDDDMDMAEMYLSEKLARQPFGEISSVDDIDELEQDHDREEDVRSEAKSSRGSLSGLKPNVEELEMLLEAYFVQIDGTLNKLSHLREYVDDTEDYINIMLDEKQNQLLQMGVVLSTATLVLTAGVVVVGIFGMNIHINLKEAPSIKFWQTTFGTIAGCVVLYMLAMGWGKKSGLFQ